MCVSFRCIIEENIWLGGIIETTGGDVFGSLNTNGPVLG